MIRSSADIGICSLQAVLFRAVKWIDHCVNAWETIVITGSSFVSHTEQQHPIDCQRHIVDRRCKFRKLTGCYERPFWAFYRARSSSSAYKAKVTIDETCIFCHSPLQNRASMMARRLLAVVLQLNSLDVNHSS